MPYTISWHQENKIILISMSGIIIEDDLAAMTDESFAMVQQSPHRVHAIVDQRAVDSMPKSLKAMSHSLPRNHSDNQGITVLVIPDMNKFNKFMASILMQIIGLEYRVVNTMKEAEDLIMGLKNY